MLNHLDSDPNRSPHEPLDALKEFCKIADQPEHFDSACYYLAQIISDNDLILEQGENKTEIQRSNPQWIEAWTDGQGGGGESSWDRRSCKILHWDERTAPTSQAKAIKGRNDCRRTWIVDKNLVEHVANFLVANSASLSDIERPLITQFFLQTYMWSMLNTVFSNQKRSTEFLQATATLLPGTNVASIADIKSELVALKANKNFVTALISATLTKDIDPNTELDAAITVMKERRGSYNATTFGRYKTKYSQKHSEPSVFSGFLPMFSFSSKALSEIPTPRAKR